MPCSRMESASSRNASSENSLRGWSADGRMRFSGTRSTRSRLSGAGAAVTGGGRDGAGAGDMSGGLPCAQGVAGRGSCQFEAKINLAEPGLDEIVNIEPKRSTQ